MLSRATGAVLISIDCRGNCAPRRSAARSSKNQFAGLPPHGLGVDNDSCDGGQRAAGNLKIAEARDRQVAGDLHSPPLACCEYTECTGVGNTDHRICVRPPLHELDQCLRPLRHSNRRRCERKNTIAREIGSFERFPHTRAPLRAPRTSVVCLTNERNLPVTFCDQLRSPMCAQPCGSKIRPRARAPRVALPKSQ